MITQLYIQCAIAAIFMGTLDALLAVTNKPIHHGIRTAVRIALGIAWALLVAIASGQHVWRLVAQLVGGAAVFAIVFRFWMNTIRDKATSYVSQSNLYDRVWLWIAPRFGYHFTFGGYFAYLVEATVAAVVLFIYTLV